MNTLWQNGHTISFFPKEKIIKAKCHLCMFEISVQLDKCCEIHLEDPCFNESLTILAERFHKEHICKMEYNE